MAKPLNAFCKMPFAALIAFLLCGFSVCHAEMLPDPTRPPATLGVAGVDEGMPSGPVLQSVLISPVRRVAVISGQTVRAGDKIGDMKVVRIMDGAVELKKGKDTQMLKLLPGIDRHAIMRSPHTMSRAVRNKGK